MDPEIEGVVQKDVGQQRTDPRPLGRASVRLVPFTALEDAGFESHLDQPEHPRIGDPVRHHPQQSLVVDRVEEAANVGMSTQFTRWFMIAVCSDDKA